MKKKLVSLMLVAAMAVTMAAGCGTNNGNKDNASDNGSQEEGNGSQEESDNSEEEGGAQTASGDGAVYYLNFKPEQADDWKALAEAYTNETGVQIGRAHV